ncbi:MAG: HEAT repeat domain-containing protein [Dysgonomonas sp.]|nr:HEAT repeat domain-containing protein [Dysgonomonas sp.]
MRLQPLYDLQQEINRLFIAGSKFAKGDPRLQKHIPVLNKLGEKAPVFKKLATDIEELLEIDMQQSAEKLMSISTLLYSVLYTQGDLVETEVEEKEQIPNIPIDDINTAFSYLQLKPVIEALTTSNSGRLEVLKDAFERNIFTDSRTYQYLDYALGDKYSELCDYVEKTIIPKVGKPIIPFLIQNFKYEDRTENARRLRLLSQYNYPELLKIIDEILSKSLPALQAEAITILSNDPKNEELIIKLADDKNKLVRESAYKALAKLNTQTSLEKLKDIYIKNKNKSNLPPIVAAIASSKLPFFFQEVFDEVAKSFEDFITLDKEVKDKDLVDKLDKFCTNLNVFENKDRGEVYTFFERVLTNEQYIKLITGKKGLLENTAHRVTQGIIGALNSFNLSDKIAFYEKVMKEIPDNSEKSSLWINYFHSAVQYGYAKEKIYDVFSSLFKKKVLAINNLYSAYSNAEGYLYHNNENAQIEKNKIDSRWIDLLYDLLQNANKGKWNNENDLALSIINACEPQNSERSEKLLTKLVTELDAKNKLQPYEQVIPFKMIMERELSNRFELIFSAIEKFPKNTYYYVLSRLKNAGFWNKFPKEYAAKFRKLAENTKLEAYGEIADDIETANN